MPPRQKTAWQAVLFQQRYPICLLILLLTGSGYLQLDTPYLSTSNGY
ncbi:hypothetical protein [Aliamphritea spongicola]|nr:hypothetical protein [Aliamphritea spongicola]